MTALAITATLLWGSIQHSRGDTAGYDRGVAVGAVDLKQARVLVVDDDRLVLATRSGVVGGGGWDGFMPPW